MTCDQWDEIMDADRMWSDAEGVACMKHVETCERCGGKTLAIADSVPQEFKEYMDRFLPAEIDRLVAKMATDPENIR